ncbi:solute carrier family 28 member 3 isoform X1 [Drosophila sechellia]|uniref:solute carrier family 28 member 3 isoform X1 n=1 Tax=Drosophila sechellia TaxID=7238 RepID=UPI0013DE69BA|nr:solute carrier family 28 member 3 isoform X1 [Drosophila sechellia]XP_032571569.1 solute carrier family 28 member 3 isoform X1 [Drosophila sechellia]
MSAESSKGAINNGYELDHKELDIRDSEEFKELPLDDTSDAPNKKGYFEKNPKVARLVRISLYVLLHLCVVGYFSYATYHYHDITNYECYWKDNPLCGINFCTGYGMLLLLLGFIYLGLFYYYVFKPIVGHSLHRNYIRPFSKKWHNFSRTRVVSLASIALLLALLAIFVYFECRDEPQKLVSLVTPCFFILCGYVFSTNRRAIKWRIVITGITCQFLLGIFCIRWEVGRKIFECLGNKVATFLGYATDGAEFVFGDFLVQNNVFAFAILPVIFFFSFFISILYYMGTMQWVVIKLGWILQQILGTTVCESVTAAANIFLGMSESPLLIRPYINKLTKSEIHSIMVSGFATVSGTVLAAYLSFGASAAHLITSSVMAAPATLAISKLYMPETEESLTSSDSIELEKSEDCSLLDAASSGASNAVPIVLGIIANIVAFVAFIAFLNGLVSWFGYLVGLEQIDFEWIFSKLFIPLVWAMGVPKEDCDIIAKVVATKTIINEFVAYERLGQYIENNDITARSAGIATFAICGFANPSSLGILIGSLSAMAPHRRSTITAVAFRAFVVGSIVCFVSASFAGILIQEDDERANYNRIFHKLGRKNVTQF